PKSVSLPSLRRGRRLYVAVHFVQRVQKSVTEWCDQTVRSVGKSNYSVVIWLTSPKFYSYELYLRRNSPPFEGAKGCGNKKKSRSIRTRADGVVCLNDGIIGA